MFAGFALVTFLVLLGAFFALKRAHAGDLPKTHSVVFGGQSIDLPVSLVMHMVAIGGSLLVAFVTGAAMVAQWPALALYWYAPSTAGTIADPIFGRPLNFYLFTLPAWQVIAGWLMTLAIICCIMAVLVSAGLRRRARVGRAAERLGSAALARAFRYGGLSACGDGVARVYQPLRAAV